MADTPDLKALGSQLLDLLKSSLKDVVNTEAPEVLDFLEAQAAQYALQAWIFHTASSPEAKQEASDNIDALKAQAVMKAMDAVIVTRAQALSLIGKVLETLGNVLKQYGPIIMKAIGIAGLTL